MSKNWIIAVGDTVNIDKTGKPWKVVDVERTVAKLESIEDNWAATLTRRVDIYRLSLAEPAK